MNADKYEGQLLELQAKYKQIDKEIIADKFTKKQADLHLEAAEVCESLVKCLGTNDTRFARLKEEHVKKAAEIIEVLKKSTVIDTDYSQKAASSEKDPVDSKKIAGWFKPVPDHTFEDVAGMEEVKNSLIKIRNLGKYRKLCERLKVKNTACILLYGPPGCGKTYIVDAFAREIADAVKENHKEENISFHYMSLNGSEILDKYVGESEKKVQDIFQTAQEYSPCVLFIDEIDGLCMDRSTDNIPSHKISLTEAFLTAYNELDASGKEVYFLAATNHPEKIDAAMHSRFVMKRVPLPDKEALKAFFKYKIKDINIALDDNITIEQMVEMLPQCTFRDATAILENIKHELIDIAILRNLPEDEAIDEVESGEIKVDRKIFETVLHNYLFQPLNKYFEELEKWERSIGNDSRLDPGPAKSRKKFPVFKARTIRDMIKSGSLIADDSFEVGKDFSPVLLFHYIDYREGIQKKIGRRVEFNAFPYGDIEVAFCFNLKNDLSSQQPILLQETKESAARYMEALTLFWDSFQGLDSYLLELEMTKQFLSDITHQTTFRGFHDSNFINAYDPFFTIMQGRSVVGYTGTCGIIASCNVVNQQTGSQLTEYDGIQEFATHRLCCPEGGTSSVDRRQFIKKYNLKFDAVVQDWVDENNPENKKLEIEELASRFNAGESIILAVYAFDLEHPDIVARDMDVDSFLQLHGDSGFSEEEAAYYCSMEKLPANHAITVAGFSYDDNNKVTGMWINDTGGFGMTEILEHQLYFTNRIYISKRKYNLMRNNTVQFLAEFIKK